MANFETYMRASSLIGLDKLQPATGPQFTDLLVQVGISLEAMHKPDLFIPYSKYCELFELAAKEWNNNCLGLQHAMLLDKSMPTIPGAILSAKIYPDLRTYLVAALDYWKLHTNNTSGKFIDDYSETESCLRTIHLPYFYRSRQETISAAAQFVRLTRIITNRDDLKPVRMHARHSRMNCPIYEKMAEEFFGCPIVYGSEYDEFIFPKELLDVKIAGNIAFFGGFLKKFVQSRFDSLDNFEATKTRMVLNAIPNLFGTNSCNFENVAQLLDIHPKALQRMLAEENTNFKELSVLVKIEKAKELLCTTDLPIDHIARYLNYVSSAPFSSAFKRETKYSPLDYRKKFANLSA